MPRSIWGAPVGGICQKGGLTDQLGTVGEVLKIPFTACDCDGLATAVSMPRSDDKRAFLVTLKDIVDGTNDVIGFEYAGRGRFEVPFLSSKPRQYALFLHLSETFIGMVKVGMVCHSSREPSQNKTRCICRAGTEEDADDPLLCLKCPKGFFSRAGEACMPCVDGLVCEIQISQTPALIQGRWSTKNVTVENFDSILTFKCERAANCRGGTHANCSAGTFGPLCSSCVKGYYKVDDACTRCQNSERSGRDVFWTILCLAWALPGVLGVIILARISRPKETEDRASTSDAKSTTTTVVTTGGQSILEATGNRAAVSGQTLATSVSNRRPDNAADRLAEIQDLDFSEVFCGGVFEGMANEIMGLVRTIQGSIMVRHLMPSKFKFASVVCPSNCRCTFNNNRHVFFPSLTLYYFFRRWSVWSRSILRSLISWTYNGRHSSLSFPSHLVQSLTCHGLATLAA